jgi:5,10-methylenetetrahydromethanopterin reductase
MRWTPPDVGRKCGKAGGKGVELAFSLVPKQDIRAFGDAIVQAEALAYSTAWVPDQGFHRDPFIALGHAATRTSRIALGLGVTNPYTRHPAMIARAAATLAEMSDGRFWLGLGAGDRRSLRNRLGAPAGAFLPAARAALVAFRDLFDGREVTVDTPVFRMTGVRLDIVPHHAVPLYLATTDPNGFRLAGELADGLILGDVCDPGVVRQVAEGLRAGAREAGRDPARLRFVSWITVVVTDDVSTAKGMLRRAVASSIVGMVPAFHRLLSLDGGAVDRIREAYLGDVIPFPEALLPDTILDKFAVIGPPSVCLERIRSLGNAGATQVVVGMPGDLAKVFDLRSNLAAVANGILPHVRTT